MILSVEQLENVSRTIYYLMRGIYDLKSFDSPYNVLIANLYDEQHGEATKYFHSAYSNIHSLTHLFNRLDHTDTEEYSIIEKLHHAITELLEELTMTSISEGYLYEKKIVDVDYGFSPFQTYFKIQLHRPYGIGSKGYNRLANVINSIHRHLTKIGDTEKEGDRILDDLSLSLEIIYSIFVDTGFEHGKKLGNGYYPIWFNSEFENEKYSYLKKNMTAETIMELYSCVGEIFDPDRKYKTDDSAIRFCECQDEIRKLFPEHTEKLDKMCFNHILVDSLEKNNAFYNGFEFGLRMAVDVFYKQKE